MSLAGRGGGAGEDRVARLRPPREVLRIAEKLEAAGHETWCVGGAVRDALLGIPHQDWDLATAARPQAVRRLFPKTIPVGIEFGTVGVLDGDGRLHEVTTFRRDVQTDGRHAVVEFGASLDEDLARRDFTINAIAYSPGRRLLHDPFDGQGDLARRVVRAVGDPAERMREDRLRALRAIRFAGRFGFDIDPATWNAIVESAPHMGRLSGERVKQELDKTFEQVGCPALSLRMWRDSGAFATLAPPLAHASDELFAALDHLPVAAGARASRRRLLRHAALFSDLRPPALAPLLSALRFSRAETRGVTRLGELWRALGGELRAALDAPVPPSDAAIRRWVARAGRTEFAILLRLAAARWAGSGSPPPATASRALYRRAMRISYRDPVSVGDLAIGGDDLRTLGVPPGPGMARLLEMLLDEVLEDPAMNSVEHLLGRAGVLAKELPEPGGRITGGASRRPRPGAPE